MGVTAAAAAAGQCLSTCSQHSQSAVPLSVYSPHTSDSHNQRVKLMSSLFTCTGVRHRQPQKHAVPQSVSVSASVVKHNGQRSDYCCFDLFQVFK